MTTPLACGPDGQKCWVCRLPSDTCLRHSPETVEKLVELMHRMMEAFNPYEFPAAARDARTLLRELGLDES